MAVKIKTLQETWNRLFGAPKPVTNKEVFATQETGGESPVKRFNYEKNDDDVPVLGLPSTFENEDTDKSATKFDVADDGSRVPALGLPSTSRPAEKSETMIGLPKTFPQNEEK